MFQLNFDHLSERLGVCELLCDDVGRHRVEDLTEQGQHGVQLGLLSKDRGHITIKIWS